MNKRQRKKHNDLKADYKTAMKRFEEDRKAITKKVAEMVEGQEQVGRLVDYILANVAAKYGVKEADGDDILGYRLEFSAAPMEEYMSGKKVKAELRDGKYIVGVILNDDRRSNSGTVC